MIPQQFIEDLQGRTDIAEIISSYIPLKRAGRNFKALCPFHSEKTPSFLISSQKQIFHCFGCGEGGGAIQFLMLYEKVNFPEAVEILAKRLGLTIPYQQGEKDAIKPLLYEAAYEASQFFYKNLIADERFKGVWEYLGRRGINREAIDKFRIGFAWGRNTLLEYLRKKNFTLKVLEKASLITAQREGGFRDLFQERIMFPIFDVRSRAVGFGARIFKDKENAPKYINSLENPLYSKRAHLFGLNFSKDDISRSNSAIVVEGYLDMIVPFMRGIKNIVASLGTALTIEQIRLIRRYTSHITLVFDSDKAGEIAALRALDSLLESGLRVKIVKLPKGFDPDSFVREKGKDAFRELLSRGEDFFDYKMGILKTSFDLESIEGKTKVAQEIFSTIHKLNSEVEKYEYIKKLSGTLDVREDVILAEFKKLASKRKPSYQERTFAKAGSFLTDSEILPITEKLIFKFILTNKKAFSVVRKNLIEKDFTSPLARKTASYLFDNYPEENSFSTANIIAAIKDKEIGGFISKILLDENIILDKQMFKESLIKLRKRRVKDLKDKLKEEMKEAESKGDRKRLRVLVNKYREAQNG